jgi:hypothetical protein
MEPDLLQHELRARGLELLGVGQHRANRDVLIVYLQGTAGQWVDGYARQLISTVPGVVAASDSVQSPAIVLVRVDPVRA